MSWDRSEIVWISETCVVIDNLLIRMCSLGVFDEEVGAGEDASNIIEELYTADAGHAQQGSTEQEEMSNELDADILSGASAEAEILFILESFLTSEVIHESLKKELAKQFMKGRTEADSE